MYWKENLITGEPLARCPVRDILDAPYALRKEVEQHLYEWFPLFEKNHLLFAGGVADQPAKYLAYMREIAALNDAMNAKLAGDSEKGDDQ